MFPPSDAWAVFLPDGPPVDTPLWEAETRPWSSALAEHYIALANSAEGLLLDPFARHPEGVLAAVRAGRRVLAVNLDPTRLLSLRLSLSPPAPRLLDAALRALADSPKGNEPLSRHLSDLYRTSCPHCGKPVTADYFIWDGDAALPVEKLTRCSACNEERLSSVTPEDRLVLERLEPRGALYWQLMSRLVAGPQDALAERAAQLLSLYTPRNRYALAELALRAETLFDDADSLRALRGLLLSCLERCHSLFAPGAPERPTRPTRLRPPRRFIERNVWKALLDSYRVLRARAAANVSWTLSLRALLEAQAPVVLAQQATARSLARALPAGLVDLVLTEPPRADAAEYALAYLWAGWLFGREATTALRPLAMPRPSSDWGWYADALKGVLGSLREVLHPNGKVVLAFGAQDDAMLVAILQAAAQAGFRLYTAVAQPDASPTLHRLVLEIAPRAPKPTRLSPAERSELGREAALAALRITGQPMQGKTLARAILYAWGRQGAIAASPDGPSPPEHIAAQPTEPTRWWDAAAAVLVPDDNLALIGPAPEQADERRARLEATWWLTQPHQADSPLADRVESFIYDALCRQERWSEADLASALYATFPGLLTPPRDLIRAVLSSYALEESPGIRRLRPEDAPAARAAERNELQALLLSLGLRLGYAVQDVPATPGPWQPCRVLWLDENGPARAFVIQTAAALGPLLAPIDPSLALIPHHVLIPGGRAALVAHKLQRVPGWTGMMAARGWQFVKNRHLRRLAEMAELDRAGFAARLSLDPIVEQPETQLSFF